MGAVLSHHYSSIPTSWSSGNEFVSGAGSMRFKSRAGQIGHSVANGLPPLRHFLDAEMGTANWLHALACHI